MTDQELDNIVAKHSRHLNFVVSQMDRVLRITRYSDDIPPRCITMADLQAAIPKITGLRCINAEEDMKTHTVTAAVHIDESYYTNLILFKEAVEDFAEYGRTALPMNVMLVINVVNVPYWFWYKFYSFVNPYLHPRDRMYYEAKLIKEWQYKLQTILVQSLLEGGYEGVVNRFKGLTPESGIKHDLFVIENVIQNPSYAE